MPPLPFDAVLFDCDGVLVDSEPITARVIADMLAELGWPIGLEESMRRFTGKAVRDELPMIRERTGADLGEDWLARFRARRNEALAREVDAVAGAAEAVRALHAALDGRIAVASGADRGKVELQLGKIGLLDCFAGRIFSGQDQPRNKPHPDVYLAAARALGADPVRCAVVEDTVTGARAGVAAGATVFGYSPGAPGHSGGAALRETGVARVFPHMEQLPALLAAWSAATT